MARAMVSLLAAMLLCPVARPAQAAEARRTPPVYPAPVRIDSTGTPLALSGGARIELPDGDDDLVNVAELLSSELGRALDAPEGRLAIVRSAKAPQGARAARVALGTRGNEGTAAKLVGSLAGQLPAGSGAYVLRVAPRGAAVLGRDAQGAFYGALTLLQLFSATGAGRGELAGAGVVDHPYHVYRGMRAGLPRGKPRQGEITHAYYRDLLRLMAFTRLNHVWVEGCGYNTPLRRHPEVAWADVLTAQQAGEIVRSAQRLFLSIDGSLGWPWLYYGHKHLAEIPEGETWDSLAKKVRKMSRVNPCPSNPELWTMVLETMEDTMAVLPGDHFAVPMDEMYQEYHGSRWAACPRCKGKDPVGLWAYMANRLVRKVLDSGRTPILGGGMLVREHQGWYKDFYKAIDQVERRDRIVIYNWSEGHVRRGAMRVGGKRLQNPTFSATPFFKQHGYKDVVHLFAGTRWNGRPEMREARGKLACYGGFVSYYHAMNYEVMKQRGALARLAFTAQHLWSPDNPPMDSPQDERACRYAEALADAVLSGKSYVEAIALARKAWAAPPGTSVLQGGMLGRHFASQDPPVNLFASQRGERTEGRMAVVLPVEEANPHAAFLVLTLYDWDQRGEGAIELNGHPVALAVSKLSNGRDHQFPPIPVTPAWLRFGPEPNVVRFAYKATAGFIVRKATIVLCDAPGD